MQKNCKGYIIIAAIEVCQLTKSISKACCHALTSSLSSDIHVVLH